MYRIWRSHKQHRIAFLLLYILRVQVILGKYNRLVDAEIARSQQVFDKLLRTIQQAFSETYRFTRVWVERQNRWQIVAGHASQV
jgi:hypothetical protein